MDYRSKELFDEKMKTTTDINEKLFYAALYGQLDALVAALKTGADPNSTNVKFPPLIAAARYGEDDFRQEIAVAMATELIKSGANVNAIAPGYYRDTALNTAVKHGLKDLVVLLLEHGADTTMKDVYGKTPIENARYPEVIAVFNPSYGSLRFKQININKEAGITTTIPGIRSVNFMVNVSEDDTRHDTTLYQDAALDFGWFKRQHDFLASLTDPERTLLRSYTRNGNEVVNTLYRYPPKQVETKLLEIVNTLKTPFKDGTPRLNIFDPVPLESIQAGNVIPYSVKYVEKLFKIFEKAPPIEKPLRVARAIKLDEPSTKIDPFSGVASTTYALSGKVLDVFMKTYTDSEKKRVFGDLIPDACCAFDMLLQPGVRAIWLAPISHFPDEHEIAILPSTVQVSFSHPKLKKYYTMTSPRAYDTLTYDAKVYPIIGKTFVMKGGKTRKHKTKRRRTIRRR